jgi:serine/threonine-protein kinase
MMAWLGAPFHVRAQAGDLARGKIPALVVGLTIGHYRILEELGGGGMGIVYKAQDTRLGRNVALKFMPEQLRSDQHAVERFHREARAASALNHPAICSVYDVGEDQGHAFIAMELLEGRTLRHMIDHAPMAIADILRYGSQIAEGLEAAHLRHVIHRDIKPSNIFITIHRQAKILDFGLAKLLQPEPHLSAMHTSPPEALTGAGTILGTVNYMAPEQVRGEPLDARADLFSFGVVLYEMATGIPPFSGPTPGAIFDAILHSRPRPPRELNPAVPPRLEALILKALERDGRRRFQAAATIVTAFEEARKEAGGTVEVSSHASTADVAAPKTRAAAPRRSSHGSSGGSRGKAIDSLAVLPLVNTSGDPEHDYLSDGLTESVIYNLSRLAVLRVVPRATVFRYKNSEKDLPSIAKELKVRAIATGRVSVRGGQLIVQAELIDAARDAQLWGERYTRSLSEALAVQDEIATAISSSLQLRLSGEDRQQFVRRTTQNSHAYEAYLKGRYYWNKRTFDGFTRATEHFQEAIDHDPNFVLAHAGLADTFNVQGYYNHRPPSEVYPRAKAAATRALEIDPTLAEAHASLAYATLFYDRDWPAADHHFQTALSHNPRYASAHQWRGWYLLVMARFDEMVAEMKQAHDLDPLSLIINDHLGYALSLAGRHDEGIAQLQRTLELDKNFSLSCLRLGLEYARIGRRDAAIHWVERASELSERRIAMGYLGQLYGVAGRNADARDILVWLERPRDGRYISPLDRALVHDGLGEIDRVFECLDLALDDRVSDLVRLKVLPWSTGVRDDSRFKAMIRQVGLPV